MKVLDWKDPKLNRRFVIDIILTDDYQVGAEQLGDMTFIHVNVRKWNAKIARQFDADIQTAHVLLGRPIYALEDPRLTPNLPKFFARIDMHQVGITEDFKGDMVGLWERTLDGSIRWGQHEHEHGSELDAVGDTAAIH